RATEPQLLDALRPAAGELRRDPAAHAHPAPHHLVPPQGVEQPDVVEGHVLDGVDLVEPPPGPQAGVQGRVDAEVPRPRLVERQPAQRLADRAVQVDQRRAVAAAEHHHGPAGQVDRLRLAGAGEEHPRAVTELLERLEHASSWPQGPGACWPRVKGSTSRASSSMLLRVRAWSTAPVWQPVSTTPTPSSFW